MPFLDEDGVTRLTEDYLDIFALKNSLDATKLVGTVPSANLPSYVDDVLEYNGTANFPATGESGKIYVDTTDNNTYRWTGSAYVSISNPLDYATQNEAEAGSNNIKVMTPLRSAQQLAAKTDSSLSSSSNNPVRNSAIKQALDTKLDIDDYREGMTWGELEGAITWGDLEHDLSDNGTTYTENYNLIKPGLNSDAGIGPINVNMDLLDDILADKLDDADYRKVMTWGEVGDKYNWGVLGSTSQTTGSTQTNLLGLTKPGNNSTVDVSVLNDNYDSIDKAIKGTQLSIATVESHIAKSNHAVGTYLILDSLLYKVTTAIAAGEAITPGSNVTVTTIEAALDYLNSLFIQHANLFQSTIGTVKVSPRFNGYTEIMTGTRFVYVFDATGMWLWDNATSSSPMAIKAVQQVTKKISTDSNGNADLGISTSIAHTVLNVRNPNGTTNVNGGWICYTWGNNWFARLVPSISGASNANVTANVVITYMPK